MPEQIVTFGPWRGSVTVREKIACQTDELGPDSTGWLVAPSDGRLIRRGGSLILGDTISGGNEVTGVLESAGSNIRAAQFIALHSPSVTDGYETPCWLVKSRALGATAGGGTLAWYSRNDSSWHQLGREFGVSSTHHYRQDGNAGEVRMKIIPYVSKADNDYGRFNTAALRMKVMAGVERVMELDTGIYSTGLESCPYWWNRRYNDAVASGTEKMRARPWGLDPPLWAPVTSLPSAAGSNPYNWEEGDTFWEAWAFRFEDGSIGPPFRISTSATTPARGGLITIGTVTGTNKYLYRTISNIPLGPKGPLKCIGRIGFRSKKIHRTVATDPNPDFSAMYPFVEIKDNSTTTIADYYGDDDNLTTIANAFFNQTWPPRAKGCVAIDGRTILWGDIKPNPYAIIVAPTGIAATRDKDADDESTGTTTNFPYSTVYYHVRVTTTHLYLKKTVQGTPNTTTTLSIIFSTYDTLQKIVDKINESVFGDAGGEWSAQLVPGVDPATKASIPNPADSTTPIPTLRATTDTGDEGDATGDAAPGDGTTLNCRAYCPQYPFVIAFSETYLATFPTDVAGLWMSVGDAGIGEGAHSLFRFGDLGDRKHPSGHAVGQCLGVEPCTGPFGTVAIVYYERARYALRNSKSGGSRNNEDYFLAMLDSSNGCVSPLSCFNGPGFSGCFGLDGVWVTDGASGMVLSRDHLDEFPTPGQLSGDLFYASRSDSALSAAGRDAFTWIGVLGDKLRIRYRKQNVAYTENGMDLWFGRGESANGLAAFYKTNDDGSKRLFGWSAPNRFQKVGVHGIITDSTGRRVFAWQETNAGAGAGRVDEVDLTTSAVDNGTAPACSGFMACLVSGDFEEIGIMRIDPMWRKAGELLLVPFVDVDRNQSITQLTLPSSGSSIFRRKTILFELAAQAHKQCVEFKIVDAGDGSGAVEFYKLPVVLQVTKAETRYN